ncbi:MAG: hypothetical protein CNE93_01510 [SAR116 cluster bacterium MED-G06]|nr:MAG: hypothetical protein CNE93_01510 [SAR116 cluster bacterium MED-G06]RPG86918.1 MAG: LapA family protein [Candidatus Puniceispirillum sp. TMED245]|tara:strand:+ start:5267 stop:5620 length:354 start_codon:yes stop_codon:yes gene_type:complete
MAMRFIGRFLWLILSLVATLLAMVFAISNTQVTMLRFWPFSGQLDIAVWGLALGGFVAGALFGGGLVWLSLVAARTRNWKLRRELGKAEKRAARAEDQLAASETDDSSVSGDVRRLQ